MIPLSQFFSGIILGTLLFLLLLLCFLVAPQEQEREAEILSWLYQVVNEICYHCHVEVRYILRESPVTYRDGDIIYLNLWNRWRPYQKETLLFQVLKQLNDDRLLPAAEKLGYYHPHYSLEETNTFSIIRGDGQLRSESQQISSP